jgi:hypothetical protein
MMPALIAEVLKQRKPAFWNCLYSICGEVMMTARMCFIPVAISAQEIQSRLGFGKIERGEVVIPSLLREVPELNDHLVWFWGQLKHKRRALKQLRARGCEIICRCSASRGPIIIRPNGAEMLHLLEVELVIEPVGRISEA